MTGDKIDVGKLICKEISKCKAKKEGNLYFPCLITKLCIDAEVEVEPSEERRSPWGAFPTLFKPKEKPAAIASFKPKEKPAAIASSDALALQRLTLHQQVLSRFVKEKFEWEEALFAHLTKGKTTVEPPEFPDWLMDEEPQASKVTKEVKEEKKKRMRSPAKKNQSPAKKKKKVSSEEEELNSEDLDIISEPDEEETKRVAKEVLSEEENGESVSSEKGSSSETHTDIQCDPIPSSTRTQRTPPKQPSPPLETTQLFLKPLNLNNHLKF